MRKTRIVVVGAGPVGAVAALACALRGFKVTLLEAEAVIDSSPRAATTHPSTLDMIAQLGLIEGFIAEGLVARYVQFWDRPTRAKIAEFDHDVLRDETPFPFVVQTEQHKLVRMALDRLAGIPGCLAHFESSVTGVRQDAYSVTATAECPGGGREFSADYLIAADGGRSTVRKLLGIAFEGYTWPERFVVLTVRNDFAGLLGCCYRNYFSDPEEWVNLFKISGDDGAGLWRAVFPSHENDPSAESRLQQFLPIAGCYDLAHENVYNVHQRVAAQFRAGRIFLAGDAAHVNNPIGGLGLNSGIHDAMELADSLDCAVNRNAGEPLLDRYQQRRRALNTQFVQEATIANKKRLEERDPQARKARFDELRAIEADPLRQKQFLMRSSLIESVRQSQRSR
jgi:3-(3-hydroxy-phenyl)propionate hydroxylase